MELIGRRFGHIRVTEVVGQGGMGDVYAGYDEKLERKVALKVLNSDQAGPPLSPRPASDKPLR